MKKILIIIIIIIIGVVFWMFKSKTNTPATEKVNTIQEQIDDTEITTINSDIESIDTGNIDQEFKDIDVDLQGL